MKRTVTYILIALAFVGASVWLLAMAVQAHGQYRQAHLAADRAVRASTNPATLPGSLVSPEPFFQRAGTYVFGVVVLAITSLLAALRTRHPVWIACLLLCGALAVTAILKTGIRF